jgi:molybdopterin synthase sulfur carrier subunit
MPDSVRLARRDGESWPHLSEGVFSSTMIVRVLYFAGLRDMIGIAEESLELPAEVRTVETLAEHLAVRHRAFAERRGHVRIARNEAFALDDEPLADGDIIALIPPVAGG